MFSKCPTLSDKLTYSHYCEVIWMKKEEMNYYIYAAQSRNLSVRELRKIIKNKEYERLPEDSKNDLENNLKIDDYIKNPILIKNDCDNVNISEKILQKFILEDITSFLKELGNGFSFVENEYKIKLGDRYNYIDLLLYNIKFKCYIVIELKITELKKEHIGQIETYMNYIDKNIKTLEENQTIGIIICRKNNRYIIEYCSDKRIFAKEYKIICYNNNQLKR